LKNANSDKPLTLAFGSCYRSFLQYPTIFKMVALNDPQLWIWMGDAAYTDDLSSDLKMITSNDNSMPIEHII
jgi:phosphodiesterase/alkaline phosphatase D-like protein